MDDSQWELCKENIQPIKQGRKASILSTAEDDSQLKILSAERQKFEKELRSYAGDDPLDVWYRYAVWVEQSYAKGGKEGNLVKLMESCFTTIGINGENENRYSNDERYLDLWIKYINLCPRALEVYQTLSSKNMFTALASFYEFWAYEYEKLGNFKKANAVYLEGLQRKAKPTDDLEMAYSKFHSRVGRYMLEGMHQSGPENDLEGEEQRKALVALRARGSSKSVRAPNERVASIIGSAGRVPSAAPKMNVAAPSFAIFQDENAASNPSALVTRDAPSTFTSQSVASKENVKNPSIWNKNKMKQKTTSSIAVEDVNLINKPAFKVHADDTQPETQATPAKPSQFAGILSARKKDKDDWHVPLYVPEPFNPNAQPQYSKHLCPEIIITPPTPPSIIITPPTPPSIIITPPTSPSKLN